VNLGRLGEISLIQISTPFECFLLDVLGTPRNDPVVKLAKEILEDESICKIVHDCR
jgi:ribonuclease D